MFNISKVIFNVKSINQAQGKVINFYKDNYLRTFFSIYINKIARGRHFPDYILYKQNHSFPGSLVKTHQ